MKIQNQEPSVVVFLANQLSKAHYRSVKDVIHNLMIAKLLFEQLKIRFERKVEEKLYNSKAPGNSAFSSEIVCALTQMLKLITKFNDEHCNKILVIQTNLTDASR